MPEYSLCGVETWDYKKLREYAEVGTFLIYLGYQHN